MGEKKYKKARKKKESGWSWKMVDSHMLAHRKHSNMYMYTSSYIPLTIWVCINKIPYSLTWIFNNATTTFSLRRAAALVKYHKIFISISFAFFELRLHFHFLFYFPFPIYHLFCILVLCTFRSLFSPPWLALFSYFYHYWGFCWELTICLAWPHSVFSVLCWQLFCYSFVKSINIKDKTILLHAVWGIQIGNWLFIFPQKKFYSS